MIFDETSKLLASTGHFLDLWNTDIIMTQKIKTYETLISGG